MTALPDDTWTLAEYVEWDEVHHVLPRLKGTTARSYRRVWDTWWAPVLGAVRLCDLTMATIQAAMDAQVATRGSKATTARASLGMLSSVLERARLNRVIDRNPAARIRGPRLQPTRPVALTPDEMGRWLDAALLPSGRGGYLWGGALVALAPLTGLRLGELRGLRWENVDLWDRAEEGRAGMVHVVEQIDSATRHTEWCPPKSVASHRSVPVPAEMAGVLAAQRDRCERQAARMGRRWREHDLVFPSIYGYALSQTTLRDTRVNVARLSELDPAPDFNALRHTYVSRLVESGMAPAQVAKMAGHADIALTIRVYYDAGPATYDAAAAAIEAAYSWERRHRGA